VIDRVVGHLPAARCACAGHGPRRAGGRPFAGMGDFSVPPATLRRVLARRLSVRPGAIAGADARVSRQAVARELAEDRRRFDVRGLAPAAHERAVRTGLAVREWLARECLTALSMNFESAGKASGCRSCRSSNSPRPGAGIGYAAKAMR